MARHYAAIAFGENVKKEQERYGSRRANRRQETSLSPDDELGTEEIAFLAARDTIYLATIGDTGWPYVQLRGGPVGFIHALDRKTLAFADFRGNTQLVSVGNARGDNRAAVIAVDYPQGERLKLFARLEVRDAADEPDLVKAVSHPEYPGRVERIIILHVEAFDWNCPQHIVPRYTQEEIADATKPLRDQLAALEAENARLRERLARVGTEPQSRLARATGPAPTRESTSSNLLRAASPSRPSSFAGKADTF